MVSEFLRIFSVHSDAIQSIGIVLTLLFTAGFTTHQLKVGSNAHDQQEYGGLMQQQQEIFLTQIENSAIYVKSLQSPGELEPHELWVVAEIIYMRLEFLRRYQQAFDKKVVTKQRDLSDEYSNTAFYLATPIGKIVWDLAKGDYATNDEMLLKIEKTLRADDLYPDDKFMEDLVVSHNKMKSKLSEILTSVDQEASEPVIQDREMVNGNKAGE